MNSLSPTRDPAPRSHETPPVRFSPERAQDRACVDALIDRAFGPGRFAKTAERLREGSAAHPELSLCAWAGEALLGEALLGEALSGEALPGEALLGAVRLWPVRIGVHPALFLGPIAVERTARGHGLGAGLVQQACRRSRLAGETVVILVGDLSFFGPLGFEPTPAGRVRPPGPVDPRRLLWRGLAPGAPGEIAGDEIAGDLTSGRPA